MLGLGGLLCWASILLTEGYCYGLSHCYGSTGLVVPLVWYGSHVVALLLVANLFTRREDRLKAAAPPSADPTATPFTRPAPVVAAAVLLMVVSAELLIAALASIVAAIAWDINNPDPSIHVGFLVLGLFAAAFGVPLLTFAVQLVRGAIEQPQEASRIVRVLGTFGVALSPCGAWIAVSAVPGVRNGLWLVGVLLTAATSLCSVFTAGYLLRTHADRYRLWREATLREQAAVDGYELDPASSPRRGGLPVARGDRTQ